MKRFAFVLAIFCAMISYTMIPGFDQGQQNNTDLIAQQGSGAECISYEKVIYMHSKTFAAQMGVVASSAQNYPMGKQTFLKATRSLQRTIRMWNIAVDRSNVPEKYVSAHQKYNSAMGKFDEAMDLGQSGAINDSRSKIQQAIVKMREGRRLLEEARNDIEMSTK